MVYMKVNSISFLAGYKDAEYKDKVPVKMNKKQTISGKIKNYYHLNLLKILKVIRACQKVKVKVKVKVTHNFTMYKSRNSRYGRKK